LGASLAFSQEKIEKIEKLEKKSKIDQLFLWKISEELKLSIKEEKLLSEILDDINSRHKKNSEEIQNLIANLGKESSNLELTKNNTKALKNYLSLLSTQSKITQDEVQNIQKKLGAEKAARYLVLKNDFNSQVKNMLLQKNSK
jgi:hypothetical protein